MSSSPSSSSSLLPSLLPFYRLIFSSYSPIAAPPSSQTSSHLSCIFLCVTYFLSSLHLQVQYSAYVGVGGLLSVVKLMCGGLLFWVLVKFSLGRKLLTTVTTCSSPHSVFLCTGVSPGAGLKGRRSLKTINRSASVWMNATVSVIFS